MTDKTKRILRDLYYICTDFLIIGLSTFCFVLIWMFAFL